MKRYHIIINKLLVLLPILFLFFQVGCTDNDEPLRLATYTYSTNNRINNLTPLSKELEKVLKRPVHIQSYPDVASFIDGIKSNEVDIGLINTLGYLLLSLDNTTMEPIATLKVKDEAIDNYKTVLLAKNDIIEDLDALKANANKLTMMFVAEGSTSGNLVPRLFLSSLGITSPENQFKAVTYGGDHTATFKKLIEGETDICAIGSNEYFKQTHADSTLLNSHKLMWTSEEIPLGPVLLNNSFTDLEKETITNLFLNLDVNNSAVLEAIKEGWSEAKQAEKFHSILGSYYDDFRMINGNKTELNDILELFQKD
ncbi:phosphate/phosphite/phosphonate ABC transporter substrate-binding protein [Flagellimonas sp. 389]|uniref:phosphate/phosphite/phosphonate ABC transporter substrate-binding protein n=1 Tax=Flagellimonas sp. 389 TaxID=2835862 RepID=UPI001BD623BA|nr:PhnD/SsuA/transferrin family substrate-binding protein [Flagellimonas sp. 389]MBS9462161.1 phosphate/phosphite/phosphonate ABC transporter substrate-binding protein [Flagellimonas sp. 389]